MPSSIISALELLDIKDGLLPAVVDKRDDELARPETSSVCLCGGCSTSRKSEASLVALDGERQPEATTARISSTCERMPLSKSEEGYSVAPTTSVLSLATPALANESASVIDIARAPSSITLPADSSSTAALDSSIILNSQRDPATAAFVQANRERSPSPRTYVHSPSVLSLATSNEGAFNPGRAVVVPAPPFLAAQNMSAFSRSPFFRRVEEREVITCQICLDEEPMDESVTIQTCGHSFGRECMRSYILSRLDERRYPIPCPTCSASDDSGPNPGLVTSGIATQVNLSDADCARWDELEFLMHAVKFECDKCLKSHAVDRLKLVKEKSKKRIYCPTPGCDQVWCRNCQTKIDASNKQKHVCEGKKELQKLLKKEGWRQCPGCAVPVQKIAGCNHIACSAPGCNTHFCYRCGDILIRSVFGSEIHHAISNHFRRRLYFWRCSQFHDLSRGRGHHVAHRGDCAASTARRRVCSV
ncbi:hypothetical protein PIIN_05486 [Serendipita indica DSM 11827]|uniref:RING-type domain-containing protein n=1 Tax=Serendipita indica (strain DSM 11827) TaxID=1109443 RepID=G4TJQ6_SERID|nr:hypothetical protein PIIN_05486 [Serendipita indica DSM 11827]